MKSKDITLGGLLTGISVVILYSTSFLPISTISILTIASCIIPICIINSSIKTAFFVYISSSILSFFICPDKNIAIMYSLFFGIYGIVKYIIEQKRNMLMELIYKFIFFNISFFIGITIVILLLGETVSILPFWLLWIICQPVFIIYDYALSMIITWYLKKYHKKSSLF